MTLLAPSIKPDISPSIDWHRARSDTLAGAISGFLATIPMTLTMVLLNRVLPKKRKDILPPIEITKEISDRLPMKDLTEQDRAKLLSFSMANHLGYGAAAGTLMPSITRSLPMSSVSRGMLYGLMVWTGSYLGLLPALDLYPNAKNEPARMNGIMIGAHVVWGSVAGYLFNRLTARKASRSG